MADIRPFRGVHYNPALIKDMARVICPPYDIITPQMQQELYQRSEYNYVRIEHGHELPQDKENDNKYTRAAATMRKWLEQKVLQTDSSSAFYINDHQFKHQGKIVHRRGIFCIVKLEDWDSRIVRPHEGTLSRPKSDRLNMLWAIRANTSPIMALYEDKKGRIASLLDVETRAKPAFEAIFVSGESHRLWAITDSETIKEISIALAGQPIYIADGHHRYESALAYKRERRASLKSTSETQPFDFAMLELIDFADPGLVILPAHRLVRGMTQTAIEGLLKGLNTIFTVEEIAPAKAASQSQIDKLLSEKTDEIKLLLCGPGKEQMLLLTLREFSAIKSMIPYFHSDLYQKLDVSIVDHVILEELLGLTHEAAGNYLDYTNDALEAIKRVREQEYQLAIIVNPVKPGVIKAIADINDRMPRKSTYFYPKAPSGLVFYKFE